MGIRNFGMGFFGRTPFAMRDRKELLKELFDKWSKMTDAEKIEFMNKRMEVFNSQDQREENFFDRWNFSVADMDSRAEEWLKKTPEEKEALIKERKDALKSRFGAGLFGRGFGFGERENCFFGRGEAQTEENNI